MPPAVRWAPVHRTCWTLTRPPYRDTIPIPYDLSEEMARRRMENEGVILTATNTLMAELAQDWSRPEGGQLLQILFGDVLPSIA